MTLSREVEDGLLVLDRWPPWLRHSFPSAPGDFSAYVGLSIDSSVNLMEDREYTAPDGGARLRTALLEQQQLLGALLAHAGRAAFDLRLDVLPGLPRPLRMSLLARTWSTSPQAASTQALDLRRRLQGLMPRHVSASPITAVEELRRRLDPYPTGRLSSAVITRREVVASPHRADAAFPHHFSVVPLNWGEVDWTPLYQTLASSPDALTLSVGLFPTLPPRGFGDELRGWATYYGRLAREDVTRAGLYYGSQKLPPDAFAVEAERVYTDASRRYSQSAFLMRVQVSGPRVAPGLVGSIAAVIAPAEPGGSRYLEQGGSAATHEVRWLPDDAERQTGRWNLLALDCLPPPSQPAVAAARDRLSTTPTLRLLSMVGDATDAACAFRLPVAFNGVVPGFAVRRGSFGQAEAHRGTTTSISVGWLAGSREPVALPRNSLTKHALVAGSTGSGKSTTVSEILADLWGRHRIPFLVIEPVNSDHDDYRKLASLPGLAGLQVITVGDEGHHPLRFNPFQVPDGVLVAEHIANLLACFKAAFGLWDPLPSIYQDALDRTYLDAGVLGSEVADAEPRRWPTATEFLRAMGKVADRLGYAGEVKANIEAASIRRAQQLVSGATASTFLTDQRLDLVDLLARPVVLELKSLGTGDEQAVMMALLLNAMTEHYKAHRSSSGELQHVTVIEEAHRLLARPSGGSDPDQAQAKERAAAEFANTLAENRKYGEGVIIAEQIPVKLVEDAVKNTNLKIMHRLTAEEDRQQLGRSMGLDAAQEKFAARLTTGEALVYSDELPEALHVEIRPQVVGTPGPVHRHSVPPFAACTPCRAKCLYRGAALSILRDPQSQEELSTARRELSQPADDPQVVRQRWDRLLDLLHRRVVSFRALPSAGPAADDASFCLFLHSLGMETMTYTPRWPEAVAKQLRITGGDHA